MILHLLKDTFVTLGIEGKPSEFSKKRKSKYVVKINIAELNNESNFFKKIKDALEKLIFSMKISWAPPDSIDREKIVKYFIDRNIDLTELQPKIIERVERKLDIPEFAPSNSNMMKTDGNYYCSAFEMVEYAGLIAISSNVDNDNLNSYVLQGSSKFTEKTTVFTCRGFFTCEQILTIYKKLATIKTDSWVSLYVNSDPDSPVYYKNLEHGGGENSYTLFLIENKSFLWYQIKDNNKVPK